MMKHLYERVMHRIQFLQELCLLRSFREALTIDPQKHAQSHEQYVQRQNECLQELVATCNFDEALRMQFHVFSLKVFRRWDSNFRKRYLAKGKTGEIIESYIEFFEFIGERNASQYLRQMCLETPAQNISVLYLLCDAMLRILRKKTEVILQTLREQARPNCLLLRKSSVKSRVPTTPIKGQPQRESMKISTDLRLQTGARSISRNTSSRAQALRTVTPSYKHRKNTPPFFGQQPRKNYPTELETLETVHVEHDESPLRVSGRGVTETDILQGFKQFFRREFHKSYELIPADMQVRMPSPDLPDEPDERMKGLWLRKNYQPLFYGMMARNQQVRNTVNSYRRHHRQHHPSHSPSNKRITL